MSGGVSERTANYANYSNVSILAKHGGTSQGDLYGADTTEQSTSTKYKTVYKASGTDSGSSYNLAAKKKGDGVYETSNNYQKTNSWFGADSYFPSISNPFFLRGGDYNDSDAGVFYFYGYYGYISSGYSFRVALAF